MNAPSVDIKDMLIGADMGLTFGINLFISREPAKPDSCVTIYDTPGMAEGLTLNRDERYEYPSIQIRVRDKSYTDGWARADQIRRLLHGRANETWNEAYYTIIKVSSGPAMMGYDDNQRVLIVINFLIQRR